MEDWPTDPSVSARPIDIKARESGPLQVVSGNRQAFALDRHAGPEKQSAQDAYHIHPAAEKFNGFVPPATLGSNDGPSAISRLHRRQQKRHQPGVVASSTYSDRSYLFSKKYLEYRDRRRKDLGSDGKQVWSDAVEEAFQEGRRLFLSIHYLTEQRSSRLSRWAKHDAPTTKVQPIAMGEMT